tara:strand:- start:438 stop:1055 length:618 start_codon:yes stop_codon:yes gene_type:complete
MSKGYRSLNQYFSKNYFLGSYLDFKNLPNLKIPEICFIGRSNVGKSSLINKIAKTKKLAKTSKTPGRTQAINLFSINEKIIIADLPGYGFAKLSKNLVNKLHKLINTYLLKRKNLNRIFLLIDTKVGIKDLDLETLSMLSGSETKIVFIMTKVDKCSKNWVSIVKEEITNLKKNYSNIYPEIYLTSSIKNEGISEIQKNILSLTK